MANLVSPEHNKRPRQIMEFFDLLSELVILY